MRITAFRNQSYKILHILYVYTKIKVKLAFNLSQFVLFCSEIINIVTYIMSVFNSQKWCKQSIFGSRLSKLPHKPKLENQSTVKE